MSGLVQDLRYGLRMMAKAPAFSLVAILTLALGIGANTAMFSVVNAVVLRPLPFPKPDQLMVLFHSYTKLNLERATVSPFAYDYYRQHLQSFSSLAATSGWQAPQNLTGAGNPQWVRSMMVTASFFPTIGVSPAMGRAFSAESEQPGRDREVVLSYSLWQQQFGADPGVLGRTVALDGNNYNVIGVMPRGFRFPYEADLWLPMAWTPKQHASQVEYLTVVGRMKDGIAPQQAKAEMAQVTAEVLRQIPELREAGWHVITVPLAEVLHGDLRPAALVLLAAVALVLLIACANVANLLLTRATVRQKEIAVRAAMGAPRRRLVRQLLTESVLLALVAAAIGVLLAYWGTGALLALVPIELPSFVHVNVDATVLLFAVALAVITGLLFGVVPAWQISRTQVGEVLKETGRTGVGAAKSRMRQVLVAGEIASAVMLLIGAGLLIRTFVRIQQSALGFGPQNVIVARTSLPQARYKEDAQVASFAEQLAAKLSALPGVSAAALASSIPITGSGWTSSFEIEGKNLRPGPHTYVAVASPQYFAALRIPLVKGRGFTAADNANGPLIAVIDQKAAATYWPGEDPIGKRVSFDVLPGTEQKRWREIVGVVGAVKHTSALLADTKGQVYFPVAQMPLRDLALVVRTQRDAQSLGPELRTQVASVDPQLALYQVRTMENLLNEYVSQPRFNMVLLGIFAGLALLLAAVGTYGVISYSVAQSRHEIGLRMALGARPIDVLRLVMGRGVRLTILGLVIGVVGALIAARALSTMLFGVRANDLPTFAAVVAVLGGIALLAMYLPARRATKVDPMIALRYE